AQISVINSRIAARLKLNPANPDFEVEIEGVTGESIMAPGFYLDSLKMPAIGEWLEYTNVPVVLLDISSPEGGKLDGIIGMNLFTQYNIVIRGGGMFLQDDPVLEFERITAPLAGDIAPAPSGDGKVDMQDLGAYSSVWMTTSQSANWNANADIAPAGQPDNTVDIQDLNQLADNWLTGSL
ncbi:MAG TPA: aspartyl protease family protein, partial [Anaerohalosphaeraceae bacterium]|nr:aspartyl protease family protein [Anaerohalosphaeraceae bacterium]